MPFPSIREGVLPIRADTVYTIPIRRIVDADYCGADILNRVPAEQLFHIRTRQSPVAVNRFIFEYNEKDHLYYRYQDGKRQMDEYDNSQLTVSNVVSQYCHGESMQLRTAVRTEAKRKIRKRNFGNRMAEECSAKQGTIALSEIEVRTHGV